MSPRQTPKRDLHAEITQALIASIEKDPGQPVMPWRRSNWYWLCRFSKKTSNATITLALAVMIAVAMIRLAVSRDARPPTVYPYATHPASACLSKET